MPPNLHRQYKARDDTTPIAVAVPAQNDPNQIYAGLPLGVATQLPFSLNAQFDIDVARRGIQHEPLNAWLFKRLAELAASVALERLESEPVAAWRAIPLRAEQAFPVDSWVGEHIAELVASVQERVRRRFRIHVSDEARRLRSLAYETEALDGLLEQKEIDGLRPGRTLFPRLARDRDGRWRVVLAEIGGATLINVRESLMLLDWEDDDLGPRDVRWFIKLARAAIEAGLGNILESLPSVVTSDAKRIVPPVPDTEGELLLRTAQNDSLASRLGLAHVVDPVYLSRWTDAVVVRKWLEANAMLRKLLMLRARSVRWLPATMTIQFGSMTMRCARCAMRSPRSTRMCDRNSGSASGGRSKSTSNAGKDRSGLRVLSGPRKPTCQPRSRIVATGGARQPADARIELDTSSL